MPIYVMWDNPEKSVICQRFVGDWTLAEYYETTLQLYRQIQSVTHKVHWVANFAETTIQPQHFIIAAVNMVNLLPKNCGTIFLLHTNQILRLSSYIITKLTPHMKKRIQFVSSHDDIYNALETKKAALATS